MLWLQPVSAKTVSNSGMKVFMITVVMPTLNSGEMLERSLPTLLSATLQGMISRVIITDGGSTDQTEAIASATGADFVSGEAGRTSIYFHTT